MSLRRFRIHLALFAAVGVVLGVVWVLTEYYEEHTWPSRFAESPDVAGTWSAWYPKVMGIWLFVLACHGAAVFLHSRYEHEPTEAEIDREVDRLLTHH